MVPSPSAETEPPFTRRTLAGYLGWSERQLDRELAFERMRKAGCTLVGTETALFEWTRAGDDAAFREVLALIKTLPP